MHTKAKRKHGICAVGPRAKGWVVVLDFFHKKKLEEKENLLKVTHLCYKKMELAK